MFVVQRQKGNPPKGSMIDIYLDGPYRRKPIPKRVNFRKESSLHDTTPYPFELILGLLRQWQHDRDKNATLTLKW